MASTSDSAALLKHFVDFFLSPENNKKYWFTWTVAQRFRKDRRRRKHKSGQIHVSGFDVPLYGPEDYCTH